MTITASDTRSGKGHRGTAMLVAMGVFPAIVGLFCVFWVPLGQWFGLINTSVAILALLMAVFTRRYGPVGLPRLDAALVVIAVIYGLIGAFAWAMWTGIAIKALAMLLCAVLGGITAFRLRRHFGDGILPVFYWSVIVATPLWLLVMVLAHQVHPEASMLQRGNLPLPGFNNIRRAGHMMVLGLLCVTGLLYAAQMRKSGWKTLLPLFVLSVAFWAVVQWSGARGALFAVFGALIATLLISRRFRIKAVALHAVALAAGAVASVFLPVMGGQFGLWNRLGDGAFTSTGRLRIWESSWEAILAYFPRGAGYGQLPYVATSDKMIPPHAHNIVLEFLLGFGPVLGAVLLIVIAWRVIGLWLGQSLALRGSTAPVSPLLLILPAQGAYALISGPLFYGWSLLVTGMAIGFLAQQAGNPQK